MGSKRKHQSLHDQKPDSDSKRAGKSESKKKRARKLKNETIVKEASPPPELDIKPESDSENKHDSRALDAILEEGEYVENFFGNTENQHDSVNSEDESSGLEPYNMVIKSEQELPIWPTTDFATLLNKMDEVLPAHDNLRFKSRLLKLDWESLSFADYSGEQCRQMWDYIQKHVRCYRLLNEIVADAKAWVSQPWTSYRNQKKKPHPEMPRRPLTYYMIYYVRNKSKVLKKNPKMDMPNLSKYIAEMYKNLSPAKKEKYMKLAAEQRTEYIKKLKAFYKNHPELVPERSKRQMISLNVPKKPFKMFYESKLKDADEKIDRNLFLRKCKRKWKNLSDKQKFYWINLALSQTGTFKEDDGDTEDGETEKTEYKKKMQNLLTKEERHLKEKLAGKPDKPPSSAYGLFSRQLLATDEIKAINPKERIITIAQSWKNCSQEEKEAFKEKATQLINQYKLEYTAYLESLTEEERLEELLNNQPKRKLKKPKSNSDESPTTDNGSQIDDMSKIVPIFSNEASTSKSTVRVKPKKDKKILSVVKEEPIESPKIKKEIETEKILHLNEPETPPSSPFELYVKKILKSTSQLKKKKIEDMWDELPIKEKEAYRKKLDKQKQSYIVKYEEFLKSLPPEQLQQYSSMKASQKAGTSRSSESESDDDDDDENDTEAPEEDEDENANSDQECDSDGGSAASNSSSEDDDDSDSSDYN